jgi:kinesin family protein 2/24
MVLLHDVDQPGSDVDDYIKSLDDMLAHKMNIITELRDKVQEFKLYLRTEERLGAKFYE